LARLLQQREFHVFATAGDISKMSDLECLPDVTLTKLDFVKPEDIRAAVDVVTRYDGAGLDCFVSNAGRNHFMPMLDENLDAKKGAPETSLIAPLALTQAHAPLLIKARRLAVYIPSTAGHLNIPYMGKQPSRVSP
jgi:1-acylglycerone phosphate reductase